MPALETPICDFGRKAPGFNLPATDGRRYRLDDIRGPKGTLIIFMCNHCPYVKGALERIIRDARDLQALGIGVAAISANDAETHPEDSFENMARLAREKAFPFPYLHDGDQAVARAYGAVCTPDFFGFSAADELQYRGRLDAAGRNPAPEGTRRELYEAMKQVADTGAGPADQTPSIGCSIKWKAA